MNGNENKKLGVIVVNGRIIDLDKVSSKELMEYITELKKKESSIEQKISKILEEDDNER